MDSPGLSSQINYRKAHKNVKKAFGKAREYPCVELICGKYAAEWSLDRDENGSFDTYPRDESGRMKGKPFSCDVNVYSPRCKPCHSRYDGRSEKISAAIKGRVESAETRAKKSAALKGHSVSTKSRKKISEAQKRVWLNPEKRKRLSAIRTGRKHSAESLAKMTAAKGGLSPKEKERVIKLKDEGIPPTVIAAEFGISYHYVWRIISKAKR